VTRGRRRLNRSIIISIYAASIISGIGFSLAGPIVFLKDYVLLFSEAWKYCQILPFSAPRSTQSPLLLTNDSRAGWGLFVLCACMQILNSFHLVLMIFKWVKYPVQLLPAVYYCSELLSRKHNGLKEAELNINSYRALYIFIEMLNDVFKVPLIFFKFMIITLVSIGFALCIVSEPNFVYIPLILESVAMLLFLNVYFTFASTIFEFSTDFISNLKLANLRMISCGIPRRRTLIMKQSIASLRRCRIFCGSQYFVSRPVVLRINDAVISNTISIFLLFKSN